MMLIVIACVLSVIVAGVYLYQVIHTFGKVRIEFDKMDAGMNTDKAAPVTDVIQKGYSFKLLFIVALVLGIIVVMSHFGFIWYAIPFLSIGTSIAIAVIFMIENKQSEYEDMKQQADHAAVRIAS